MAMGLWDQLRVELNPAEVIKTAGCTPPEQLAAPSLLWAAVHLPSAGQKQRVCAITGGYAKVGQGASGKQGNRDALLRFPCGLMQHTLNGSETAEGSRVRFLSFSRH